jgi:hypothetical protein
MKIHISIKGMGGNIPTHYGLSRGQSLKKAFGAEVLAYWAIVNQLKVNIQSEKNPILVLHILPGLSGYVITIS